MDYFDGLPAYHAAQQALLEGAMRRIDWVDPDLSATTAASSLCADQFARIAKASTLAKIRVLLRNDTYLWRRCQRLTMLLNAYSHVLEIRLVDEVDAPQIPACL
uniref:hypothetical protein n=1 Tax=Chitinimonas sp. TaxID=1934313 RepID=UPI0035B49E56